MSDVTSPGLPFDEELDEDLRDRIKAEVDPDEPVLWAGRPSQTPGTFAVKAILSVAFDTALFALFAGCVAYIVRNRPADPIVPFILGGVSLFIACCVTSGLMTAARRWRFERTNRAGMSYALTPRRVIFWRPTPSFYSASRPRRTGIEVSSCPRRFIKSIHRVEYPDGSGDLVLNCSGEGGTWGSSQLEGVADIRRLERIFRDVLALDGAEELRGNP